LDERAIAKIKGSALALDLYVWLVYRLPRLARPVRLSWHQLKEQFGSQIRSTSSFAQNVREALLDVLAAYPDGRVEILKGGVELQPARPAIPTRRGGLLVIPGRGSR
jgi:Plasmid encoded RepA protein